MRRRGRAGVKWLGVGVLALGLLVGGSARAGDGMRLRTPVLWSDVPCMTVVDRSLDPVVHVPYEIPFEDTERTKDEVADGRTHQFFALCRDHDPTDDLPAWISEADVAAAEALRLIDLGTVVGDAILDLDPQWQGCALRITPDDARRPITFAAAAEGVDWDTAGIEAGAWVVEAFTHDPAYSIWSPRPGVFKVVDGPELSASGPAVAVLNGEEVIGIDEAVTLEGCVSAMPDTALSVSWAEVGERTWHVALEGEPVAGEGFALDLQFPPEMAGQAARVRVDAEDPTGRAVSGYMSELVIILPAPPGCDDDCGGSSGSGDEGSGASETGSSPGTTGPPEPGLDEGSGPAVSSTGGGSSGTPSEDEGASGCACTQSAGRGAASGVPWLVLVLLVCRRRLSA